MDWYVVRYTVKPHHDLQSSLTMASSIAQAITKVTTDLKGQGINPHIEGAYLDTPIPPETEGAAEPTEPIKRGRGRPRGDA